MILYTCGQKKSFGSLGHPCGRAAKALDEAGYEYEIRALPGYRLMPWTWGERRGNRKEVEELTGQTNLPPRQRESAGRRSIRRYGMSLPNSSASAAAALSSSFSPTCFWMDLA